jgi:hypothetical protein
LRAYISAMTDLTPPEIIAWLDTLPLKDQLMSLHAMTIAIPALQRSQPLNARTAAIRVELRPTAEELGDILRDASRRGEQLKEEFAG